MSMMGSGSPAKPSQIRLFLRADSAEELVRLQLQTNVAIKGQAAFTDFSFVQGQWYCWFSIDVDRYKTLAEEILNGAAEESV